MEAGAIVDSRRKGLINSNQVRSTILIASPTAIQILQEQPYLQIAHAFGDSDVNDALAVIRGQDRPLIVIERDFARSARGEAFINQLNEVMRGTQFEVRIVGVRRAAKRRPAGC